MTKVMPTASRPVIDTWRITLNRLICDRKRGSMIAKSSISAMRNSVGAKRAMKPKTSTPLSSAASSLASLMKCPRSSR
jgi:hypothetical protein